MDFHRLFDVLPYQQKKYPHKAALSGKRDGVWRSYSTEESLKIIDRLSTGLLRLGLQSNDKAAILAHKGSPEWNFADFALQQIGAVVVPVHASLVNEDVSYIFKDAGVRCCFVSNQAMLEKAEAARSSSPAVQHIFSFEKLPDVNHWEELLAEPDEAELDKLKKIRNGIEDTALATIIYTSGTTGHPKGVMLSHRNIVSNIKAIMTLVPVDYRKRTLSFLPLSHIFERMVTCFYMAAGAPVWYSGEVENFLRDAQEIQPHFFTAVPRILERMHERILETRKDKGDFGKRILDWALAWGENYDPLETLSPVFWMRHKLLDLLVYRQWRKTIGGKVEGVVVGAAALQPKLARLFNAAGIRTREGYGLTETSPVVAFNHFEPGLYRFGTVGIPIPGVEVKIDTTQTSGAGEDVEGEILVKGPNVMLGYYNLSEETTGTFTTDGWLRTGDVGRFVYRRFLQITDRKRDIFKTSSGKFVAPQRVENHFRQSHFIRQCMVLGLNKPFVSALIVPDFSLLEQWCLDNGVHWTAPQFMALNPKVLKFMSGIVEGLNQSLEPHEQVRRFTLLHEEWSREGGELTLTMKLSRPALAEKFRREIEEMYKV